MARRLSRTMLCSSLAMATALMLAPRPAAAQSFIGTVNSSVGANVHTQGNGITVINVQNTQAVINWTATGASNNGVITFQPAGTTASFRGNSQFAVLNRVTPGVAGSSILLDGIIETQSNNSGGGGTIFFSSPNGVIIGQNAVIDVGSLGLTALPVASDANGNWISGFGTSAQTISFGPAVNPNAFVRINPGATLAVRNSDNYIALVAPKVDVQGTIKTDGVAALVAAEQATLTIRDNGLWDIIVGTGTTDPNGIVLNGTITRNTAAVGGNHTAYLVSVAKNDAVTMLFNSGSKLGFDVAGSAGVEGNSVVLSAGASVLNGSVAAYPAGAGNSNITLDGVSTDSKLAAIAHGTINVNSDGGASIYGGDVTLAASGQINVTATNNNLTFAKTLTATTDRTGTAGGNATAGNITVGASGGKTLTFAGLTTLSANGAGGSAMQAGGIGGTGIGGTITIAPAGGTVTFNQLTATARGTGGTAAAQGGVGQGGTVSIGSGGGVLMSTGTLSIDASGVGGNGATGGAAVGGAAQITASGGTVNVASAALNASAAGGAGNSGAGGAASGGLVAVTVTGGGGTIDAGSLTLTAHGTGGVGGAGTMGGAGTGGTAFVNAANSETGFNLVEADQLAIDVRGQGGNGGAGANGAGGGSGGAGGTGKGGDIFVQAGVGNGIVDIGNLSATTTGRGGNGGAGGSASAGAGGTGGSGGVGRAGNAYLGVTTGAPSFRNDGRFEVDNASVLLSSVGGNGGAAGSGTTTAGAGGRGGNADGGSANVTARGGAIDVGSLVLAGTSAGGSGGSGAAGGNALTSALSLNFAGSTINPGIGSNVSIDNYIGTTSATASAGGTAQIGGNQALYVEDSSVRFGNYSTAASAAGGWAPGSAPDTIRLLYSAVTVDEAMTVTTDNRLSVLLDGSTLGAGSLTLDAADFVYDVTPYAPAADQGTIAAGWIDILSGQDIIMDARLVSGSNLFLYANGLVDLGDLAAASTVSVTAGTTIALGDVDAGGSIWMNAGGSIDAGDLTGYDVALWSSSGDISLGSILAGGFVDIDAYEGSLFIGTIDSVLDTSLYAGTNITVGSITVGGEYESGDVGTFSEGEDYGQSIDLEADGTIVAGNLTAADSIYVTAGGNVRLGNLSAGLVEPSNAEAAQFVIGVVSGGNLSVLDAAAASHIGLGAAGSIVAGAIDSGRIFLALAGGDVSIASILAVGPAYLADASMIELGQIGDGEFDPAPILAAAPVRTGGSISVAGPIDAGSLQAAAGNSFNAGSVIVTDGLASIDAGANVNFAGNVAAGGPLSINADGAINAKNLSSGAAMTLASGGNANILNAISGGSLDGDFGGVLSAVDLTAGGAMTIAAASGAVHNLSAGGAMTIDTVGALTMNDASAASMDFDISTALTAHDLSTTGAMAINAGTIQANDLMAGGAISLTTNGNATVHNVTAGDALNATIGGILSANNLTAGTTATVVAASAQANDVTSSGAVALTSTGDTTVHDVHAGTTLTTSIGGKLMANDLHAGGSASIGAASLAATDVATGGNTAFTISGNANVRDVAAGGSIGASVGGNFVARNLTAGNAINANASTILANDLTAGQSVALTSLGNSTLHNVGAGTTVTALVGGTLTVNDIDAGGNVALNAATLNAHDLTSGGSINVITFGALTANDMDAAGSIALDSQSTLTTRHLTVGEDIYAWSVGAMALGNLDAGSDIGLSAGTTLIAGSIAAGGTIVLAANGDITTGAINAGNHFLSLGGAKMTFAAIDAGGTAFLANQSMQALGGAIGSGFDVDAVLAAAPVATNAAIVIGGDTTVGSLRASAGTDFAAGNILSVGPTQVEAKGNITANIIETYDTIDLIAGDYVQNSVGSILTGDVTATGEIAFTANGTITSGDLTAGSDVTLVAPGAITTGDITAGGFVGTFGFGAFDYEGADVAINGGGSVSTGNITATDSVAIAAVGTIDSDDISAGGLVLALGGADMSFGSISTGGPVYLANRSMMALGGTIGEEFDFAPVLASAPVASGGSISVGDIAADWLAASAGTSVTAGAIDTWGSQFIRAGATISTGALHAGGGIDMLSGTGLAIAGGAYASGHIALASTSGPIATQAIRSDQSVEIDTAGTVTGTTVSAGDSISVWGTSGVTLTDLDAGIVEPVSEGGFDISVGSNGAISVGAVHAANDVGLAAGDDLTAGSVTAGGDMLALAGGNTILGTIDVGGRLGIAGFGMLAMGGGKDEFDKEVVFAALQGGTATATGGSVTINGAVHASDVDARVGQNLTTAAITTPTLSATVDGTATINGQWNVWDSTWLKSNDVAIGVNGGISGYDVMLLSSNTAQALVGDGLVPAGQTPAGYWLDGSEFARIDANDLTIVGNGAATGRIDMLIGDLVLEGGNGEGGGEQTAYGQRSYRFVTTSADNSQVEGVMRVVGDVMGPADYAAFIAGTVEVDGNTATIALESEGNLTGVLEFVTPHLHVASETVLDKLQTNLNYANRNFDLQTPTATSRPEGVVRADTIYVDPDNGSGASDFTLLVQNTGTSATRAGFLARYAEFFSSEGSTPGAIDMVINGQIDTGEGILTGKDVRDALMEGDDPARFKAGSTINGCPVTGGACTTIAPPPPPPPSYDPNPPLQGQLVLISTPAPDKLPFGNEETIEDNQEDGGVDSASSPILAPQPLFDTGPLLGSEETDEPISGGGNPALTGSGTVSLNPLEEDEEEKKRKKKAAAGRPAGDESNGKVK